MNRIYPSDGSRITLYDSSVDQSLTGTIHIIPRKKYQQIEVKKNVERTKKAEILANFQAQIAPKNPAPKKQKLNATMKIDEVSSKNQPEVEKKKIKRSFKFANFRLSPRSFKTLGIVTSLMSLFIIVNLISPVVLASVSYFGSVQNKPALMNNLLESAKLSVYYPPVVNVEPEIKEFKIQIPKIGLESDVITNVNPNNETEYVNQLKNGVAQAQGSYLPNQSGPMVLFAHSTDTPEHIVQYNAKFYALHDLEVGDAVKIQYNGKSYSYLVEEKQITSPHDLSLIQDTKQDLVLSTCWPPGTSWQRLLVFAKKLQN